MDLRTIVKDGQPWFVANDVLAAVGLTRTALAKLEPTQKGVQPMHTLGGRQSVLLINEAGLYKLIMRSDKPTAMAFQNWIAEVVLPAIRKDGMYVSGEEKVSTGEMTIEQMTLKVMTALTDKVNRLQAETVQQQAQLEAQKPAVA
jgi:prophage antirepressor-like protein